MQYLYLSSALKVLSERRLMPWRIVWFVIFITILCAVSVCHANSRTDAETKSSVGKKIYQEGMLHTGAALAGIRADGLRVEGADAACVNCHQRSGLGSTEGQIVVPPVSGNYLFFNPKKPSQADLELAFVDGMRLARPPYTLKTLARAIRDGIGADGKALSYMMPRFALDDEDMASLISYLKQLDHRSKRGVTQNLVHFATIITPDADPVKRQGMLAVLKRFFADKNMAPVSATPHLHATHKLRFHVNPHWQLHVWQLTGPAETWKKQLEADIAREPVFAVISGIGGKNWAPVHEFCEQEKLPCLFPNVEVPPAGADQDFFSLYFSKGVLLEAGLIANQILNDENSKPVKTVRQIYRDSDSGVSAAKTLTALLRQQGIKVDNRKLPAHARGKSLDLALEQAPAVDALVLWLRPDDIKLLEHPPPANTLIYMSGLMGGLEQAPLPSAWRKRTNLTYPVDLPMKRRVNVDFAFGWFRLRQIPLVAARVQVDTYLACGILAGTLHRMVDNFVPEYLIERIQGMLDNRLITGYYPHLTLATGQRFASKGGYIVRFSDTKGTKVMANRDGWQVPY